MIEKFPIPDLTLPPPLAYSFVVFFYPFQVGPVPIPIPNPLDIRFQSVSGIGKSFDSGSVRVSEGKQNGEDQQLRGQGRTENLVLKRGLAVGASILKYEVEAAILGGTSDFHKQLVHVMLMNEQMIPVGNWLFRDAYPISYSISDLDANQNQVVIESITFKYSSFYSIVL